MRISIVSAFGLVFALAGSASAGTLTTGYVYQGNDQNVCIAINVGKKPIEVTVEAVPLDISAGEARSQTCTLQPLGTATTVPDGGECETFMNAAGFCRFTAPGSVGAVRKAIRGVLVNRDTASPFGISATLQAY